MTGNIELLSALAEAGANPNIRNPFGKTALHGAFEKGSVGAVIALLQAGASPNEGDEGTTLLHRAASTGNLQLLNALVKAGAESMRPHEPPNYSPPCTATVPPLFIAP